MAHIVLIDYKMGNLYSIANACEKVDIKITISNKTDEIKSADALILPGVGAYPLAVEQLKQDGLHENIKDFISSGKKVLGICLGMQLLMDESDEFGIHKGLGLIEGSVQRFPNSKDDGSIRYVPQINWNNVVHNETHPLFDQIKSNENFYFVHSNYVKPKNIENVLSETIYNGFSYCSSVHKDNLCGIQFHPEKSGKQGLQLLANFKKWIYS